VPPTSSPLLPSTVLATGAVLLWLIRRIPETRWPGWAVVRRALPVASVSIALLALWALNRPVSPVRFLFLSPPTLGIDLSLRLQSDGWSRLFGLMLLWPALFAALSDWFDGPTGATTGPPDWHGWLLCLAAAQFALAAADWLTLTAGLLAFDLLHLVAFSSQQKRGWTFGANGLGNLALFATALLLTVDGHHLTLAAEFPLPETASLLIVGAALLRLAPYPLHFWLSDTPAEGGSAWRWPAQLVSPLLGLALLARLASPLGSAAPARGTLMAMGLAGCLATALLAWLAARHQPREALPFAVLFQLNLALLGWIVEPHRFSAPWIGLALLLAVAALALHRGWIETAGERPLSWRDRAPGGLAAAALAGLPLTVGFFVRAPLYGALLNARQIVGLIVFLSAEGLHVAALLRLWDGLRNDLREETPQAAPVPWQNWGVASLLNAPLLVLGLFPSLATQWVAGKSPLPLSPWQALSGAGLGLWAALLIPWALGYSLYRSHPRWPTQADAAEEQIIPLFTLDWLHRAADGLLGQLRQALWSVGRLLHGEGYLAWVALSLLLIAVLFLGR
jgi:hypothetical protein